MPTTEGPRKPHPKTGDLWEYDGTRWRIDRIEGGKAALAWRKRVVAVPIGALRDNGTPIECIRHGDTIIDPLSGHNEVLDLRRLKLLLKDSDGLRFVLNRERLAGSGGPWTHHPPTAHQGQDAHRAKQTPTHPALGRQRRYERRAA